MESGTAVCSKTNVTVMLSEKDVTVRLEDGTAVCSKRDVIGWRMGQQFVARQTSQLGWKMGQRSVARQTSPAGGWDSGL